MDTLQHTEDLVKRAGKEFAVHAGTAAAHQAATKVAAAVNERVPARRKGRWGRRLFTLALTVGLIAAAAVLYKKMMTEDGLEPLPGGYDSDSPGDLSGPEDL
jgi:hypothetical protein